MRLTLITVLIGYSGLAVAAPAKEWKCFGIWRPSIESALVLGCHQLIQAQVSEGVFEVRHLVRVTPQKCVYDEVNSAPEGPGTRLVSCDKPQD